MSDRYVHQHLRISFFQLRSSQQTHAYTHTLHFSFNGVLLFMHPSAFDAHPFIWLSLSLSVHFRSFIILSLTFCPRFDRQNEFFLAAWRLLSSLSSFLMFFQCFRFTFHAHARLSEHHFLIKKKKMNGEYFDILLSKQCQTKQCQRKEMWRSFLSII